MQPDNLYFHGIEAAIQRLLQDNPQLSEDAVREIVTS